MRQSSTQVPRRPDRAENGMKTEWGDAVRRGQDATLSPDGPLTLALAPSSTSALNE